MEIIIFTNNGATFMFKACRRIKETKEGLQFTYTGVSTAQTRDAKFLRENLAGYAIMDPSEGETEGINSFLKKAPEGPEESDSNECGCEDCK